MDAVVDGLLPAEQDESENGKSKINHATGTKADSVEFVLSMNTEKALKDRTLLGFIVFIALWILSGYLGTGPLDVPISGQ